MHVEKPPDLPGSKFSRILLAFVNFNFLRYLFIIYAGFCLIGCIFYLVADRVVWLFVACAFSITEIMCTCILRCGKAMNV